MVESEPNSQVSEIFSKAPNVSEEIKTERSAPFPAAAVATNVVSAAPPPARTIITQATAVKEPIKEPIPEKNITE